MSEWPHPKIDKQFQGTHEVLTAHSTTLYKKNTSKTLQFNKIKNHNLIANTMLFALGRYAEMSEWSNVLVSKTSMPERASAVRIRLSAPKEIIKGA